MKKSSAKPKRRTSAAKKATPKSAPSKHDPAFSRLASAFTKKPGVTFNDGKGFGSRALKVNGKIFAMLSSKEEFVVKLPKERVEELVAQKVGKYFDAGKGKPMKEWLSIFGMPTTARAIVGEAYEYGRR
jgi:YjbR protein